jgi:hypothetical protein
VQPNKAIASQPSRAARSAHFSEGLRKFLQSSTNWRQRQRSLQGPFFKLLEQNGKAVGQLTLHRRILVLQSLSNT